MDLHLSREQEMLRKMYRDFAENEVKPLAEWVDENEAFPEETVKKMAKLGMMGIYFPKEYGGARRGRSVLCHGRRGDEQGLRHHRRYHLRPHLPVLRSHL